MYTFWKYKWMSVGKQNYTKIQIPNFSQFLVKFCEFFQNLGARHSLRGKATIAKFRSHRGIKRQYRHKKFGHFKFKIRGDIGVPPKFIFLKYLDLGTEIAKSRRQAVFKLYLGSMWKFTGKFIVKILVTFWPKWLPSFSRGAPHPQTLTASWRGFQCFRPLGELYQIYENDDDRPTRFREIWG